MKKISRDYGKSVHTRISFYFMWFAFIGLTVLGIRYINDANSFTREFAKVSLIEGFVCFLGIYGPDFILGNKVRLKPNFRKFERKTSKKALIIFIACMLVQIFCVFVVTVPLTIETYEIAYGIISAGIAEEGFFRGFIITLFIVLSYNFKKYEFSIFKEKIRISIIEIFGIILSAVTFAFLHKNYLDDPAMLLSVFIGGIVLGICFWHWKDLSANIIAHFVFNLIKIGQLWVTLP